MKFKRVNLFAICFLFVVGAVFAQSLSETKLAVASQLVDISVVPKGGSVTLSFVVNGKEVSYQWFQSTDGTVQTGVAIEGATESEYTTSVFVSKSIRYYYCVATDGNESIVSNVAVVAYTGLPILYVNTEVPITSVTKTDYAFGNMRIIYENGDEFFYEFKKEES